MRQRLLKWLSLTCRSPQRRTTVKTSYNRRRRTTGRRVKGDHWLSWVFHLCCSILVFMLVLCQNSRQKNRKTTTTNNNNNNNNNNNQQQQPTTTTTSTTTTTTTNNQQPTTNNQQPTTNNQQPRTKNQEPTTNTFMFILFCSTLCLPFYRGEDFSGSTYTGYSEIFGETLVLLAIQCLCSSSTVYRTTHFHKSQGMSNIIIINCFKAQTKTRMAFPSSSITAARNCIQWRPRSTDL